MCDENVAVGVSLPLPSLVCLIMGSCFSRHSITDSTVKFS